MVLVGSRIPRSVSGPGRGLRVADLSALVLEFNGQRDALCTIRGVRDPTPGQRRSAAREELVHLLGSGDTGPEAATRALQAFGRCLRWELGALWRGGPPTEDLRCAATWHVPQLDLGGFEETSQYATFPPRVEALRRTWLRGEPTWIPDLLAHSELPRAPVASGSQCTAGRVPGPALRRRHRRGRVHQPRNAAAGCRALGNARGPGPSLRPAPRGRGGFRRPPG